MHVVLGATGHIGSALAEGLLDRGEPVIAVSRDARRATGLQARGARIAVADVNDVDALRDVLADGTRLFALNPPGDPVGDASAEERRSAASIVAALDGSPIAMVVAASTYGAQEGADIGDLGVLYEMEQALAGLPMPTTVVRGAYYMSNWDGLLEVARDSGELPTFFPPDAAMPMVDPADIGRIAVDLMVAPPGDAGLHHVEGPERYAPDDVAEAFAAALGRDVRAVEIPEEGRVQALGEIGFSERSATSFAGMTAAALRTPFPAPEAALRGTTTIGQYVKGLTRRAD